MLFFFEPLTWVNDASIAGAYVGQMENQMKKVVVFVVALAAFGGLAACSHVQPSREGWNSPTQKSYANWEALFAAARPVQCCEVVSGELLVKRQQVLDETGAGRPEQAGQDIRIDVRSLVLTLPDGRIWLVDAGLGSAFAGNPRGSLRGLLVGTPRDSAHPSAL